MEEFVKKLLFYGVQVTNNSTFCNFSVETKRQTKVVVGVLLSRTFIIE